MTRGRRASESIDHSRRLQHCRPYRSSSHRCLPCSTPAHGCGNRARSEARIEARIEARNEARSGALHGIAQAGKVPGGEEEEHTLA